MGFNDLLLLLQKKRTFKSSDCEIIFKTKGSGLFTKLRMLNKMNILNIKHTILRDERGKIRMKTNNYIYNPNTKDWRLPSKMVEIFD